MRILIIEDNHNKLKQIKLFVGQTYPEISIHDAVSYTAGLRRIYEEQWDLLLLDMSLPIYDIGQQETGGDKKSIAGKEIMKRMIHRKIFVPTIIITQFDTFGENEVSISTLNKEFDKKLNQVWRGTINYEDSTNMWKVQLKKLLDAQIGENTNDKDIDS